MLQKKERIVAKWDNGAYCSLSEEHKGSEKRFVDDLVELTRQFGSPNSLEILKEDEGWHEEKPPAV